MKNLKLIALLGVIVFMSIPALPRGIRNKNPLNIRGTNDDWQGKKGNDSKGFVQFVSVEYGIRAGAKVLKNYYRLYGINTIAGIINRFAPPSENDTSSYAQHVAREAGVSINTPIDLEDSTTLANIINTMIKHENGVNPYSMDTIKKGVLLSES